MVHENILRLKSVTAKTGLARSTIYKAMANGHFPKPISIGARAVGWLDSTINEWIADRVAASTKKGV